MEVQPDYRDLLALFNGHEVEYIVVGAYALAFHGAPRFTADLDILVKADPGNSQRILAALEEFGFGSVGLTVEDFQHPEKVVQLGVPPVRVDILTSLTGVLWEEAFSGRAEGKYGDVTVYFIGREQFLANRRALRRKQDLADLEALGEEE
jgi:hypothetical protein